MNLREKSVYSYWCSLSINTCTHNGDNLTSLNEHKDWKHIINYWWSMRTVYRISNPLLIVSQEVKLLDEVSGNCFKIIGNIWVRKLVLRCLGCWLCSEAVALSVHLKRFLTSLKDIWWSGRANPFNTFENDWFQISEVFASSK